MAKPGSLHSSVPDVFESRGSCKQAAPGQQSQSRNSTPEVEFREARTSMQVPSLETLAELVQEHSRQLAQLRAEHEALRAEADNFRRCLSSIRGVEQSPQVKLQPIAGTGARGSVRTQPDQLSRGVGRGQQRQRQSTPQVLAFGCRVPARTSETAATSSRAIVSKVGRSSVATAPGSVALRSRASTGSLQRGRTDSSPGAKVVKTQRSRSNSSEGVTDECPESGDLPPRRRTLSSRTGKLRGSTASEGSTASQGEPDLYDQAQPLLEPTSSAQQQASALQAVEAALRRGAAPGSWQGPGTPLRTAVEARHVALVRILLKARANPDECDERAVSALHAAAFHGQQELCNELLQAKANANVADQHGQTPLFFAPTRSICELLCACRADTHATNLKGQSAVHFAGQAALSDVLLWFATRVNRSVLDLHDVHGATAAYYARAAGVKLDVLSKLQQGEQSDATGPCRKTLPGRVTESPPSSGRVLEIDRLQQDVGNVGSTGGLPPLPEELSLYLDTGILEGGNARTCIPSDSEADTPESSPAGSPFLNQLMFEETAEHMAAARIQAAIRSYLARKHAMREETRGRREDEQQVEGDNLFVSGNDTTAPELHVRQSGASGTQRSSAKSKRVLRRVQSDNVNGPGHASQKSVSIEEDPLPASVDDECGAAQTLDTPRKSKANPPRSLPGSLPGSPLPGTPRETRRDRSQNERRSSTTSPPPVATKQQREIGRVQSARTLRTRSTASTSTSGQSPGSSPQQSKFQPASTRVSPLRRSLNSKSPTSPTTPASAPPTPGRVNEPKAKK